MIGDPITITGTPNITITPTDAGTWASIQTYRLGSVVTYNNNKYICLSADESQGPVTTTNRGTAYSGWSSTPPTYGNTNAWKIVTVISLTSTCAAQTNPNPSALTNEINTTASITWCMFVIKRNLVPSTVIIGQAITITGTPNVTITPRDAGTWASNGTYRLGDIVTFNNIKYICLSADASAGENRGDSFTGWSSLAPNYGNTNAWKTLDTVHPAGYTSPAPTSPGPTSTAPTSRAPVTTRPGSDASPNASPNASNTTAPPVSEEASEWIKGIPNTYVIAGGVVLVIIILLLAK
jgi:hypothetical protein